MKIKNHNIHHSLLIGFFIAALLLVAVGVFAATSPWNQTDWSGGLGISTSSQYYSSQNIDHTSEGVISLSNNGDRFLNGGFESGTSYWTTPITHWNLDGSSQYIRGEQSWSTSGFPIDSYAVSLWLRTEGSNMRVFGYQNGSTNYQRIDINSLGGVTVYGRLSGALWGAGSFSSGSTYINDGEWHHIVLNKTLSGPQLYIDGVLANSLNDPDHMAPERVGLGATLTSSGTAGTGTFVGDLADMAIFDGFLSSADIVALYNGGAPRNEVNESLSERLLAYWRASSSLDIIGGVSDLAGSGFAATMYNMGDSDIFSDSPLTIVNNPVYSGTSSAHIQTGDAPYDLVQEVDLGDSHEYMIAVYAYEDGSTVTSSDVELLVDGATINTTYTNMGNGWWRLSAIIDGDNNPLFYGVQIKQGKDIYIDSISLSRYEISGTLTSNIYNTDEPAQWGALTYVTGGSGSVAVRVRTSNDANMIGAPAFSACDPITTGSDISSNNCVQDDDQYVQYQVSLSSSNTALSPTVEDIEITFVTDVDAPTFTDITLEAVGNNSATISWTTNEPTSTFINYGVSEFYDRSTLEQNIASKTTTHVQTVSLLRPCTTYHFRTRGLDEALNEGVSGDYTFTTTGCISDAIPTSNTVGQVPTSGGVSTLSNDNETITLNIPAGFNDIDTVVQIKQMIQDLIVQALSTPDNLLAVGSYLYDLSAFEDSDTQITSFDENLEVSITYDAGDLPPTIDLETLTIYRHDGNEWSALSGCAQEGTTVTCLTSQFSTFGLFAEAEAEEEVEEESPEDGPRSSSGGGGGSTYRCHDPSASNYSPIGKHKQDKCEYPVISYATHGVTGVHSSTQSTNSVTTSLGLIKRGNQGTLVKILQVILNLRRANPPLIPDGMFGPGTEQALMRYQYLRGLTPDGVAGPRTWQSFRENR